MIDYQHMVSLLPDKIPETIKELNPELCIYNDPKFEVWFAPMGSTNRHAKIAIFGITPGWTQMKAAYAHKITKKDGGNSKGKGTNIAFAGSMRTNLVLMLDEIGLPEGFDITSSSELFTSNLLHASSVLKYPVFKNKRNYSGSGPSPLKHDYLKEMIDTILVDELKLLSKCLIVPLGKSANEVMRYVREHINPSCCLLDGFPHPSGANVGRVEQFNANKQQFATLLSQWFSKSDFKKT